MTREEIKKTVYDIFSENTMMGAYTPSDTLFDMAPLRRDSEEKIKRQIYDIFGLKLNHSIVNMRTDRLITMIYLYALNRGNKITNNFLRAKQLDARVRHR